MNTTAAATAAQVSVPTIRTWCRNGVVAATKTAGRWIIDTASLTARIAIGAMRTRKATMTQPTGTIVQMQDGLFGVRGDATLLAAAFEASTPITPTNPPYAGDRIHLGCERETYGDYGRALETVGLAYTTDDGQAVYHINTGRLRDEAPAFYADLEEMWEREDAAEDAIDAQDNAYFNPRYV